MIANKIVRLTKERGCGLSFYPIVAFGRWSAYPHHKAGKRRLRRNDLVLIDLGAKYKSYCADLTRTFTFGPPDKKQKAMIELVLKAQTFAIKKIKTGMGYREADQLVRKYFLDHGVKPGWIRHGLGHGIGHKVHEGFVLSIKTPQDRQLKIGDIFTLEPGLYLKGWGGVRIEDTVVLTKGGVKPLTSFPKKYRAGNSHH